MGMQLKFSLICICLMLSSFCSAASDDLVIKSAERTIDITSQLVRITHKLTLSNTGKSAVRSFDFPIETKAIDKLSYFKAQVLNL